jgi:hypothetical protein
MTDDGFCPPNGRQNKPNKNINGNWMYAVSVSAHGSTSSQKLSGLFRFFSGP